jgi:DNA-binding transcriptional MocR family regulator
VYSALPYSIRKPRHAALILGYTTLEPDEIARGIEKLAHVLREQSPA